MMKPGAKPPVTFRYRATLDGKNKFITVFSDCSLNAMLEAHKQLAHRYGEEREIIVEDIEVVDLGIKF